MLTRRWLFLLSYNIRYIIIIILLSSFFFLSDLSSNLISSHQLITLSITNHLSLQHLSINQTVFEKQFPFTNRTINIETNRTVCLAVVSAIYNDDYITGVEVLGYSLRRLNIQADLILFYISNRLNQVTLNRCRKAGWYLWSVERINPPRFAIIYPRFYDQYTKLRIWSMIGYDRVLYLDADTLVIRNINELLIGTIFEDNQDSLLGAVEDVWQGQIGPNFNGGVLLIRPNQTIFNDMLIKMHNMAAYGSYWAEQGFLNWYFKGRYVLILYLIYSLFLTRKDI
jgi:alpha-N-acetylglucosamine transferase